MPRKRWTTPEQRSWLEERIPDFTQAQQDKTMGSFLGVVHQKWQEKWPAEEPTEEEIQAAKGNKERAEASKRKVIEERVKYWFHNNTRGSSSGTGARGVLKLSSTPKLMHPWQAYQNKFYDTKLRPKVDEAWKEYLDKVPYTDPQACASRALNPVLNDLEACDSESDLKDSDLSHMKAMKLERNKKMLEDLISLDEDGGSQQGQAEITSSTSAASAPTNSDLVDGPGAQAILSSTKAPDVSKVTSTGNDDAETRSKAEGEPEAQAVRVLAREGCTTPAISTTSTASVGDISDLSTNLDSHTGACVRMGTV
ncbi:hypothetical protein M378DRAFT_8154 [Amanita muscaria Koide BX008]|uniref:Uncharacterized protein n=1 Tax=Amanita muscaria (strain Koide BX008) TaxID=946122 RepID=A0A0C2TNC3_AMAMK|nr:hypothetical protein M378DRAFT_8154 [Amanita muscaria Koide BX008]